ncbi:MAG: hypothetical protein AAFY98_06255 [Verrucomicrobiota bacterium]
MKFIFINHYIPPDDSPTAGLIADVGIELVSSGHEVHNLGRPGGYQSGLTGIKRWTGDVTHLLRLLFQLLSALPADRVIALSSPPGLHVMVAVACALKRTPFVLWLMDIYPDLAFVEGLIPNKTAQRIIHFLFNRATQRAEQVIVLDEDMRKTVATIYSGPVEIQAPWPKPFQVIPNPPELKQKDYWLYSGNLGRAHLWKPLLEAQKLIEDSGSPLHLVIQGGGFGWRQARAEAARLQLKQVHFRDYCPVEELPFHLLQARALVASLKPEMTGLLWPSKLSLMLESHVPVAWIGKKTGSIAEVILKHEQNQCFLPDEMTTLSQWITGRPQRPPENVTTHISEFSNRVQSARKVAINRMTSILLNSHD